MASFGTRALVGAMVVALAGAAGAVDYEQDALKMIIKQNTASGKEKAVWVSKNPAIVLPSSSPIALGATLRVTGTNQDVTVDLPGGAANWKTNGAGTLYKFVNKLAPGAPSPCKVALIKQPTVFKLVCKDSIIDLDDTTQGTVDMAFTVGNDRYCSSCTGGVVRKDEPGKFIAKVCPAPGACPGPAPGPTCCSYAAANQCLYTPSPFACSSNGATPGAPGTTCSSDGTCQITPVAGACCALAGACIVTGPFVDCVSDGGGTLVPNALCLPDGTCASSPSGAFLEPSPE